MFLGYCECRSDASGGTIAASTQQILEILAEHEIEPLANDPRAEKITGEIGENEDVFEVSVEDILGEKIESDRERGDLLEDFDPVEALQDYLREMRGGEKPVASEGSLGPSNRSYPVENPPEPFCAWYCPVHYFGADWGIYIREDCTIRQAFEIARHLRRGGRWRGSRWSLAQDLIRASFYAFYLHEQFHHKVESFAFRLLVSTRRDCYRPYQSSVYVPKFRTLDCIEESLANADSVRRLNEPRYKERLNPAVRQALKTYLEHSIPKQPPVLTGFLRGRRLRPPVLVGAGPGRRPEPQHFRPVLSTRPGARAGVRGRPARRPRGWRG